MLRSPLASEWGKLSASGLISGSAEMSARRPGTDVTLPWRSGAAFGSMARSRLTSKTR